MARARVTFLATGLILLAALAGRAQQRTLPDGLVTRHGTIEAVLIDPTDRYGHGVLGDAIEAGGFAVTIDGRRHEYRLPENAVFEDRRVRLVDLDGDGLPEALLVKSYLRRGSALAAFDIGPQGIRPRAESPAIGAANRWLNPVGVGRFGEAGPVVAAVVTPHLAGSLRFYRLIGDSLKEIARIDGYTNHIIGSRDLDLGFLADVDGDGMSEVVLPTLDRRALAVVSLRGSGTSARIAATTTSRITGLRPAGTTTVALILEDGTTVHASLLAGR